MAKSYESRAAQLLAARPALGRFERRERTSATIETVENEGGYLAVSVTVPESFIEEHTIPGQYCSVIVGTEPRFLVLSNAPGERWEFLVEVADSLDHEELQPGNVLGISAPEGTGYPVERGGPVLIIASGSAIASMRPVWRHFARQDGNRRLRIVYSENTVEDIAFRDELDALSMQRNVEVEYVLPELLADAVAVGLDSRFSAFICGPPDQMQPVAETLLRYGISETAIFTNI